MDKHRILGVSGDPVFHSFSPNLFSVFFRNLGIDGNYLRISAANAGEVIGLFKSISFSGMNITTPFKTEIIKYLDELDPVAEKIGAVNVVLNKNGVLKGYNTDHIGVVSALKHRGSDPKNRKCLVLGAGGAARAAAYGLLEAGAEVTISNRDVVRGIKESKRFGIDFIPLPKAGINVTGYDVVVDTLPGNINLIERGSERNRVVVLKADYRSKNAYTGDSMPDGLDWLYFQGVASFKLLVKDSDVWDLRVEEFRASANKEKDIKSLFIVGFTGSGKSHIGEKLSNKTGYKFVDLDKEIERSEGRSVKELFDSYGEQYFRKVESKILSDLIKREKVICSCGGGIVTSNINKELLKEVPVVWLHTDLSVILRRIRSSERPILYGLSDTEIGNLYRSRMRKYSEVTDLLVLNNGNDEEAVTRIFDEIFTG